MGFSYEPCPWCESTKIKLIKKADNRCCARCSDCNVQLVMSGGSMMDCARTWNARAARRNEMKKQNMTLVSLLHADIANNDEKRSVVSLENSDEMWQIAVAAETAWDMDVTPVRMMDRSHFEIRYVVLFAYLDALVKESSEKIAEPDLTAGALF